MTLIICIIAAIIVFCFLAEARYLISNHLESYTFHQHVLHLFGRIGLFLIAGTIYVICELLFRGYSHWSMFVLAGLLAIFCIDMPNNIYSFDLDYRLQVLISTVLCTVGEGLTGLIVNKWLHWNVWDYSHLWGTFFFGQCNILFVGMWIVLIGLIGIPICDAWNYYICRQNPVPYYVIGDKKIFEMKRRWWL